MRSPTKMPIKRSSCEPMQTPCLIPSYTTINQRGFVTSPPLSRFSIVVVRSSAVRFAVLASDWRIWTWSLCLVTTDPVTGTLKKVFLHWSCCFGVIRYPFWKISQFFSPFFLSLLFFLRRGEGEGVRSCALWDGFPLEYIKRLRVRFMLYRIIYVNLVKSIQSEGRLLNLVVYCKRGNTRSQKHDQFRRNIFCITHSLQFASQKPWCSLTKEISIVYLFFISPNMIRKCRFGNEKYWPIMSEWRKNSCASGLS